MRLISIVVACLRVVRSGNLRGCASADEPTPICGASCAAWADASGTSAGCAACRALISITSSRRSRATSCRTPIATRCSSTSRGCTSTPRPVRARPGGDEALAGDTDSARCAIESIVFERRYGEPMLEALGSPDPLDDGTEAAHLYVEGAFRRLGLQYTYLGARATG